MWETLIAALGNMRVSEYIVSCWCKPHCAKTSAACHWLYAMVTSSCVERQPRADILYVATKEAMMFWAGHARIRRWIGTMPLYPSTATCVGAETYGRIHARVVFITVTCEALAIGQLAQLN